MGNKHDGYIIQRICPGAPILLVFGAAAADGDPFENGKLWERIAEHRGRSCSVVLLEDARNAGYYRGIAGLGDSIDETAESLRSMIASFNASEVITCGVALGGHAALVFGALLAASRVVAVEPVAHLIADELERYNDRRWRNVLAALPGPSPGQRFNAVDVMTRCGFAGEAFVLCGTGRVNANDYAAHLNLIHAQWLASSDRVTLYPFSDIWQDLWVELERRGQLEEVMKRYLFEEQSPRQEVHKKQRDARTKEVPSQAPPAKTNSYIASVVRDMSDVGSQKTEVVYAIAGNAEVPEIRIVDDELRRWIAENLLIGQPPASIVNKMKTIAIPESVARDELRMARDSPYLRGALRMQNRLKKRDWLLAVYSKLGRLHPGFDRVERRYKLSGNDFLVNYYALNRPVVIGGMIDDWPERARSNLDELERRFGDRKVTIRVRLNETDTNSLSEPHAAEILTFAECLRMIRTAGTTGDYCLTNDDDDNQRVLSGLLSDVGRVPEYLAEASNEAGTFRLDAAGAIVPFRQEFKNLLIAQVMGKVRVKIVPSWDTPSMRNTWQNLSERDGRQMFSAAPARSDRPLVRECIVEQGDLLFLPVGCWLFIETIEISAAVTFTNFVVDNDFSVPDIVHGVL
jgi:hypothetical protein